MSIQGSVSALLSGHFEFAMDAADGINPRVDKPLDRDRHLAIAAEIRRVYILAGYDLAELPVRTIGGKVPKCLTGKTPGDVLPDRC